MEPPRALPPALVSVLGLALALLFGRMTSWTMTQEYPLWLERVMGNALHTGWFRLLAWGISASTSVCALLVLAGYARRTWAVFAYRVGLHPVIESEGPCRLVQDPQMGWGLALLAGSAAGYPAISIFPGGSAALPADPLAQATILFFRLDESTAARMSRLYHPMEVLRLRWCDFPGSAGGPILLEARGEEEPVSLRAPYRSDAARSERRAA
jgi:hypothetical protein